MALVPRMGRVDFGLLTATKLPMAPPAPPVGFSRIEPDLVGYFREVGFTLAHLASFCFVSTSCFSQRPVTTCFVILDLGSFRKNMVSHRDISNPKCSFFCGKTIFPGFDRDHHLGSFCQ